MSFALSTNIDESLLLEDFGEDLQSSGSLPYLQVIHPSGKDADELTENPLGFGMAISEENAEAVSFQPTADWVEGKKIRIHMLTPAKIEHGWVARKINFCVLAQSELEIQQKVESGEKSYWRFLGLAYEKGQLTRFGQLWEDHKRDKGKPYRMVCRYLLLLLDDNGKPLHDRPLQFTSKGAFSQSLGQELKTFYGEVSASYRDAMKAAGKPVSGQNFSSDAHAYMPVSMDLGFHIPEETEQSSFLCVAGRLQPTADKKLVGKTAKIKRRDRSVEVTGSLWSNHMIPKGSPLGELIAALVAEFKNFGLPNRGLTGEDTPVTATHEGYWDLPTFDGVSSISLRTDKGVIPCHLPADHLLAVDCTGSIRITGTVSPDGSPLTVTSWENLDDDNSESELLEDF